MGQCDEIIVYKYIVYKYFEQLSRSNSTDNMNKTINWFSDSRTKSVVDVFKSIVLAWQFEKIGKYGDSVSRSLTVVGKGKGNRGRGKPYGPENISSPFRVYVRSPRAHVHVDASAISRRRLSFAQRTRPCTSKGRKTTALTSCTVKRAYSYMIIYNNTRPTCCIHA